MNLTRTICREFGPRIIEERKRLRLNQADFGALGEVTQASQVNYENGYRVPNVRYLSNLRKHGVDAEYLLSGQRRGGDAMTMRAVERRDEYVSPGLSDDQANVLALELLRQFDGQPLPVVQQVLRRAEFWLSAVSTLNCGEATEFARAVEGLKRAAGESL